MEELLNQPIPDDLIKVFFERRKMDLRDCLEALALNKLSIIEKVGHKLKGNGATFGFPQLSMIGKKLEVAAAMEDLALIEQALEDFSLWVKSFC